MKLGSSLFFLLTAVKAFLPQTPIRPAATLLFMSTEVSVKEITGDADERMGKTIDSVKMNLSTIRTGRASSNMLDRVKVDYYGTFSYFGTINHHSICRSLLSSSDDDSLPSALRLLLRL